MSLTLHKILMHSADVNSSLSISMLVEEASEFRNKDYKNYRLNHNRIHSRKHRRCVLKSYG